jgi:hypothetical protein
VLVCLVREPYNFSVTKLGIVPEELGPQAVVHISPRAGKGPEADFEFYCTMLCKKSNKIIVIETILLDFLTKINSREKDLYTTVSRGKD